MRAKKKENDWSSVRRSLISGRPSSMWNFYFLCTQTSTNFCASQALSPVLICQRPRVILSEGFDWLLRMPMNGGFKKWKLFSIHKFLVIYLVDFKIKFEYDNLSSYILIIFIRDYQIILINFAYAENCNNWITESLQVQINLSKYHNSFKNKSLKE
jgi:hypothetical protein